MIRKLMVLSTAGTVAVAVLAVGGPVRAHAAVCSNGMQSLIEPGVTGSHHAFDSGSSSNCVVFDGDDNSAYLKDDSDNNFIGFSGIGNAVQELRHSSNNFLTFSGNDDTLSADYSSSAVEFTSTADSDVVALYGVDDPEVITISGSDDYLVFNSGCTGAEDVTSSGLGSSRDPLVVC